jgi:Flp pilus assembly protein CpaB
VVVGGFLVAVAAVVVFSASLAGASKPGQSWVVAARPLPAGSVLAPADLASATMRLSGSPAAEAFRQAAAVEGRTLAVALPSGALVEAPELVPVHQEPALRPVSVAVDPVSLAGLAPGQPVDVLTTQGSGSGAAVEVVVRGATLLAAAPSSSGSGALASAGTGQVTIGVASLAEVEAVVQASHTGTISLVAAEPSDGVGPGPGPGRS